MDWYVLYPVKAITLRFIFLMRFSLTARSPTSCWKPSPLIFIIEVPRISNSKPTCLDPSIPQIHETMPVFRPSTRLPNRWASRPPVEQRALALEPVRLNHGTLYPCSASQLYDTITYNPRPRRSSEYVSADEASREIQTHNALGRNLSRGEYDATSRLESIFIACMSGRIRWTPDLIIKAFCDIDRVFFLGFLRGHVHVEWKPADSFSRRASNTVRFAATSPLAGGKAKISLNAYAILGSVGFPPFKYMWRVMLHEMWYGALEQSSFPHPVRILR